MSSDQSLAMADLPASAKLVVLVLEQKGALTQKELRRESLLSERTARAALQRLKEHGFVEEQTYFPDAR